jgi:hypothetical protein
VCLDKSRYLLCSSNSIGVMDNSVTGIMLGIVVCLSLDII